MTNDHSKSQDNHPHAEDDHQLTSRIQDLKMILIISGITIIALSFIFKNESFLSVVKISIGLIWMFVLPGMVLLDETREKLSLLTRMIISVPLSAGLFGLISYPLGLLGISVSVHGWLIPITLIAGTFLYHLLKEKMKK